MKTVLAWVLIAFSAAFVMLALGLLLTASAMEVAIDGLKGRDA